MPRVVQSCARSIQRALRCASSAVSANSRHASAFIWSWVGSSSMCTPALGRQLRWPLSRSANNNSKTSFSLSALCQVSISLYEAPQPKLRGGIRCSEHQHAHAFCASEAIFGTKHFGYFPLSPLGRPFRSYCKAQCRGCGGRVKRRPAPNGLALRGVTPSPARPTERQF